MAAGIGKPMQCKIVGAMSASFPSFSDFGECWGAIKIQGTGWAVWVL